MTSIGTEDNFHVFNEYAAPWSLQLLSEDRQFKSPGANCPAFGEIGPSIGEDCPVRLVFGCNRYVRVFV